jgi:hypothetical protein
MSVIAVRVVNEMVKLSGRPDLDPATRLELMEAYTRILSEVPMGDVCARLGIVAGSATLGDLFGMGVGAATACAIASLPIANGDVERAVVIGCMAGSVLGFIGGFLFGIRYTTS